jgi:hypothetical protein
MTKQEIQSKIDSFKKKLENQNLAEYHDDFRQGIADLEKKLENLGKATVDVVKPTKERKPRVAKPKSEQPKQTKNDVETAKAEIKRRTGKTEEECEKIIAEYRSLRTKSQERKKKEAEASKTNAERINKLKDDNKVIEGTTEKTADAVIETTTKDVAQKIEKQIDAIEQKAETEAKKEVEKEMPKVSATEKKKEVEKKVEEKVKEKAKTIVKTIVIDTSALLKSISESLGKFDKDSQKEFLIKLRSDIDKLLSKYGYGGMTSGATQGYNITQSNMSSSSVNMFGNGGGVGKLSKEQALKMAINMGVDFEKDFHAQSYGNELSELAKKVGYRKSSSASGSLGRQFFYHLQKIYDKKKFGNGGGVENAEYEVVNRNDMHYGEVGVSLHGWNLDERGRYYCTLQFPNGSVSTYGEGEVSPYQTKGMRFTEGGGVSGAYKWKVAYKGNGFYGVTNGGDIEGEMSKEEAKKEADKRNGINKMTEGGKIEYNQYGVPQGYLYLSEFANFDRKGSGNLKDVEVTILEDNFLEDQSHEGQQIHAYLHDLPYFVDYETEIPRYNPTSPVNDEPMTDNYLLLVPIQEEDEDDEEMLDNGVLFRTYFVDTQGYDYPRYITRLENYFPSDEQVEELGYMKRGGRTRKFMAGGKADGKIEISTPMILQYASRIVKDEYTIDETQEEFDFDESVKKELISFLDKTKGKIIYTEFFEYGEDDGLNKCLSMAKQVNKEYPYIYNSAVDSDGFEATFSKIEIDGADEEISTYGRGGRTRKLNHGGDIYDRYSMRSGDSINNKYGR